MELKSPLRIVDDEVNGCFYIEDADGVTVADDGSATGEYAPKMTREFANLVVTAPELLKRLECSTAFMEYMVESGDEREVLRERIQRNRAAIAKATGSAA